MHWKAWAAVGGLLAAAVAAGAWSAGLLGGETEAVEATAPRAVGATAAPAPRPAPTSLNAAWLQGSSPGRTDPPLAFAGAREAAGASAAATGCGQSLQPCAVGERCPDGGCAAIDCDDRPSGSPCLLPGGGGGSCCANRCADLSADPLACGRCGTHCAAGEGCADGRCLAASCQGKMSGVVCVADGGGGSCCRGSCVDRGGWATDAQNCGSCGHACAPDLACLGGLCVDPATGSRPGWTCNDAEHLCPAGRFCVLDACLPAACGEVDGQLCPIGNGKGFGHCCGADCVDLFEDRDHCRSCDRRCPEGQSCRGGACSP